MSGMNEGQVTAEMNKMVSFIKQEALEKAREIKVKADEEFNIEKAKIVRSETVAIDAFFAKKTKQAESQRKIAASNQLNKARLRILQARQQVLTDLIQEARSRLPALTKDTAKYQLLLKELILQCLFDLTENKVTIQCRKVDLPLVQKAMVEAKALYEKSEQTIISMHIDEANPLPDNCAGGVVLSVLDGRIRSANTLENRLELLSEKMLPDIRILLFGTSPNRAFYN